jgi:hypothetical protein
MVEILLLKVKIGSVMPAQAGIHRGGGAGGSRPDSGFRRNHG